MASQTQSHMTSQPADRKHHVEGILPERSVAGLVLIAIGVIIVLSRLVPGTGEYVLLAVGITCLIAFMLTREYGWAVAAGIICGLGVGVVLSTLFDDPSDGMVFMLSLAGGFAAVWILGFAADPPESNPWPLVPAVILAAVAISIITDTPGMVDGLITVVAVLLVLAGLRSFRRGRAEKAAATA
jgi:hypothetical protein